MGHMLGQRNMFSQSKQVPDSASAVGLSPRDSARINVSLSSSDLYTQDLYVDTVIVSGNKTTKDYIILREMELKPGVKITEEAMQFDKSRIYSLGLFTRVDIYFGTISDNKATLIVEVNERWFLFPFPILGIKDRDWSKFYYGLGVYHTNFRGRNERVSFSFALGYDPWVRAAYQNPVLDREQNLFLETEFSYSKIKNKSLVAQEAGQNFDELHYAGSVALGKRLSLYHNIWTSVGYEVLEVSENSVGRTISSDGKDRSLTLGFGVTHDTRDLREYAQEGTYAAMSWIKHGIGESAVDYTRFTADFRRYMPLYFDMTLAWRLFTSIASGPIIPYYGHVYFGYGERIRGHFTEISEGDNIFGGSVELRLPIIKPRYLEWEDAPYPEIAILKYGLFFTVFADAGSTWYKEENPLKRTLTSGYGVGLNFLLPYSVVLRTEFAVDEQLKGQFIFDASASF